MELITANPNKESLVMQGNKQLDFLQKRVKELFSFLEKESKKTGLDQKGGYLKFYNYKVAFNKVVKDKGNEGMSKLLLEWRSYYDRMESKVLAENAEDFGDHWKSPNDNFIIFANGKIPGTNKLINLFFFMKHWLELKENTEKVIDASKNDDDVIGDMDSINRCFELKLKVLKIFSCVCSDEDDLGLINRYISELEIRLDITPDKDSEEPSDILGGIMNTVTSMFSGKEGNDKPGLPDLNSLGDILSIASPEFKDTVMGELKKLQDCSSKEDLFKQGMSLIANKELQQKITQMIPGANMMNEEGNYPDPMQTIQNMATAFMNPGSKAVEENLVHEY